MIYGQQCSWTPKLKTFAITTSYTPVKSRQKYMFMFSEVITERTYYIFGMILWDIVNQLSTQCILLRSKCEKHQVKREANPILNSQIARTWQNTFSRLYTPTQPDISLHTPNSINRNFLDFNKFNMSFSFCHITFKKSREHDLQRI